MTQTVQAEGDSPFFEGLSMRRVSTRLTMGPWRFVNLVVIAAVVLLGIATVLVVSYLPPSLADWTFAPVVVYLLVMMAMVAAARRLVRKVSLDRWYARGAPRNVHIAVGVAEDGLRIAAETATTVLHWPFVSEITTERSYWFVYVAAQIYFVPRRFFADPQHEQAFVAAVLEKLSPAARARSRKAEDFLAGRLALPPVTDRTKRTG